MRVFCVIPVRRHSPPICDRPAKRSSSSESARRRVLELRFAEKERRDQGTWTQVLPTQAPAPPGPAPAPAPGTPAVAPPGPAPALGPPGAVALAPPGPVSTPGAGAPVPGASVPAGAEVVTVVVSVLDEVVDVVEDVLLSPPLSPPPQPTVSALAMAAAAMPAVTDRRRDVRLWIMAQCSLSLMGAWQTSMYPFGRRSKQLGLRRCPTSLRSLCRFLAAWLCWLQGSSSWRFSTPRSSPRPFRG